MSRLFVSIILLILGMGILFIRLFFLEDQAKLTKEERKKIEVSGWQLLCAAIIFLANGLFGIWFSYHIHETIQMLNDFYNFSKIICFFLFFISIILLYYKENIFKEWGKKGMKVPKDFIKYRNIIIIVGVILLIISMFLIIKLYAIPFISKYYLIDL